MGPLASITFLLYVEPSLRSLGLGLNLHVTLVKVESFISKLQVSAAQAGLASGSIILEALRTQLCSQDSALVCAAHSQKGPVLGVMIHCCCLEILYF